MIQERVAAGYGGGGAELQVVHREMDAAVLASDVSK